MSNPRIDPTLFIANHVNSLREGSEGVHLRYTQEDGPDQARTKVVQFPEYWRDRTVHKGKNET